MESTDLAALRLTEVRKAFGAVQALRGVSLEVKAGEVHALLGENGAGKSTLMAVAAGSLSPDGGTVEIGATALESASPGAAQALGLGVVYQHPALADDLSVVENMILGVPRAMRPVSAGAGSWAHERLTMIGAEIDPTSRVSELNAAESQLVEIAKALALEPRVLILDEPTAALDAEEVRNLFEQIRAIRERGTAVVYISHRIPEVKEIADRLTVLRDGEARGTFGVHEVDEAAILKLIAGRALDRVFPGKLAPGAAGAPVLTVSALSGGGFDDVSLEVREGEILGVAGVAGNGQRDLVRALAGLVPSTGTVTVSGKNANLANPRRAQRDGIFYISSDRRREGLFPALTVRENAVASSLKQFTTFGGAIVSASQESNAVAEQEGELAIKAASQEADIGSLSGGNQQKVVFARAMLGRPKVLICDEPTQGVDVGARVEIYRLLRELAADGCAIIVCSSDALELEGLCDRVTIMSRGAAVAVLESGEVSEEAIMGAAVTSTQVRKQRVREEARRVGRLGRFLRGDGVATPVLAAVIVALALFTQAQNGNFLTSFNIENLLLLSTALILVSLGQLVILLIAGVDLSVGPIMGLGLVILTSFATDTAGTGGFFIGLGLALAAGAGVGLINGGLVQFARIDSVIATLATFIGVQGIALLINPVPTGLFSGEAAKTLSKSVGGLPIVFIICVVLGLVAEYVLRRTKFGVGLRAVGSDEAAAHRMGLNVGMVKVLAFVLSGLFAGLASVMLAVQIGTGDATAGQSYTLQSIAAVVLGGASIYGGRGSFLGTVLGALLLTEMINAITFLELTDAWQFWFPGAIILVAAAIYARVSRIRLATAATEPAH